MKVRWLPRATMRLHTRGTERTYILQASTTRRPSWQTGETLRGFTRHDTLTVRIPIKDINPIAPMSSYACPCNPRATEGAGVCPACAKDAVEPFACSRGSCCTDPDCADKELKCVGCHASSRSCALPATQHDLARHGRHPPPPKLLL